MGLTSISVIMTVFILNLHYRGPNEQPVPGCLRRLFIRHQMKRGLTINHDQNRVGEYFSDTQSHYVKNVSLRMTIEDLAQELTNELDHNSPDEFTEQIQVHNPDVYSPTINQEHHNEHDLDIPLRSQFYPVIAECSAGHSNNAAPPRATEEILNALKKVIQRNELDDCHEHIIYEWRQVAVGVDRILFWIFFVGTVSSTVIVLIIAPLTKWL